MSLAFHHTGPVEGIRSDLNLISLTNIAPIRLGVMVTKCGAVSVENWSLISCKYNVIIYQVLETWNKLEEFAEPLDVKTKARINLSVIVQITNKRDYISREVLFFHCIWARSLSPIKDGHLTNLGVDGSHAAYRT